MVYNKNPFLAALMDEKYLVKMLEYGKIQMKDSMVKICNALGIEFYYEPEEDLYTISSEFFVLDVRDKECSLIFVEDALNEKLCYIQAYLTYFLEKKHIFYFLLRFLVACTRNEPHNCKQEGSLERHKCICSCISSGNYCKLFNLSKIENGFNIFTHRNITFPIHYYFLDLKMIGPPKNLAELFPIENFNRDRYNQIENTEETYYECGKIKVIKNCVFIDEKRSPVASMLFLKGCSLKESIKFAEIFK